MMLQFLGLENILHHSRRADRPTKRLTVVDVTTLVPGEVTVVTNVEVDVIGTVLLNT
jgi:hypothetical protein